MGLDHAKARRDATEGFKRKFQREPSLEEVQLLQAVGALETGYGTGWKGVGKGSFNMGAIIAGGSWHGDTFTYKDSYPDEQGVNHWYETQFRKYPDAAAGWEDLANIVYEDRPTVHEAAIGGDTYGFSAAMYETRYYAGFGKNAQERIGNHHKALMRNLVAMCHALNEPLPGGADVALYPMTLKRGSTGPLVVEVQRMLGLVADGMFGPLTTLAVKTFQADHGLVDDGVVGSKTWAKLREVHAPEEPPKATDAEALLEQLRSRAMTFRGHLDEFVQAVEEAGR